MFLYILSDAVPVTTVARIQASRKIVNIINNVHIGLTFTARPCTVLCVIADVRDDLTGSAIARLAGVGRAAVSNWRRRYPDFPKPIGGTTNSPTFSRSEVEDWLRATGKAEQLATAGRTETGSQRVAEPAAERAVTELSSGEFLAEVMVSLLPESAARSDGSVPTLLDPACASGTVLAAAADRFADRIAVAGRDIDERASSKAAARMRRRNDLLGYDIRAGDSMLGDNLRSLIGGVAAVVCEPPLDVPEWPRDDLATDPRWRFGVPAPRDGELAWVQLCYAYLRPGGVAVVAVSPRTCVQPSGQQVRANLVRLGALRDVIALPHRMSSIPGRDVYLWVLERRSGPVEHPAVRFVDLSAMRDTADVPHEIGAWEQLFADAEPTVSRVVPAVQVLDRGASLLPSDYVTRVEASAAEIAAVVARLRSMHTRIVGALPECVAPPHRVRYSDVTIAELERVGALTIRARDTTPRAGDVLLRTLGRPPVVATGTSTDDAGVAQVVEINEDRLDPHFVATFLRADANATPTANTLSALSREDLRRCRVPRMTLAEQRAYGDAFRHLFELQSAMAALASVGSKVIDQMVHGLTIGAVSPAFGNAPTEDEMEQL